MKHKYLLLKSLFVGAFIFAGTAVMAQSTGSVTINPEKDNTLYESSNGTLSNGNGAVMVAGRIGTNDPNGDIRRAVIEFDIVSGIPTGATIDSVLLTVTCSNVKNNTGRTHTLHVVNKEWGEGTSTVNSTGKGATATTGDATWKHSSYSGTNWTNLGGDYSSTASATTTVSSTGTYTFTSTAMKNDVQSWVNNPNDNHGWMMKGDESTLYTVKIFNTSESASGKPELKIWYTCSKANFTIPTGCVNAPISFNNTSTNAVSYRWDFDNNGTYDDTTANPSHTFTSAGAKQVKLVTFSSGGCKDSVIKSAIVFGAPNASFTHDTACAGSPTTFTSSIAGSKFEWDFNNDGDFDSVVSTATVMHPFQLDGIRDVIFRVTDNNGCKGETVQQVYVPNKPFANFTTDVVCGKSATTFKNVSVASSNNNVYRWDFDNDGTIDSTTYNYNDVPYTYATGGTKQAKIIIITEHNCLDTTVKNVTVDTIPEIKLAIDTVCFGVFTQITNNVVTPSGSSYKWDFDNDGTYDDFTGGDKSFIFPNYGANPIKVIVEAPNNCIDSLMDSAVVEQGITVSFTADTVCFGVATTFTDNSTTTSGADYRWDWDDDGTVDDNTSGNNTNMFAVGVHTVELAISDADGCKDSATLEIEVKPLPTVNFSNDDVCLGTATTFTDNSSAGFGPTYKWDFDNDGTVDNGFPGNIQHTYTAAGTYTAKLIIETIYGCIDSMETTAEVKQKPVSSFTASLDNKTDLTLTNASTGDIDNFEWDFGDGSAVNTTDLNATHVYDTNGTYTVCLKVSNECGDSITCDQVSVTGVWVNNVALLNAFSVAPNPFANLINIETNRDFDYNVKVTDLQGRVIYTTEDSNGSTTINLANYSKGIYFVTIETEIGFITHKIIKSE